MNKSQLTVPLLDLKAQYATIFEDVNAAIKRVVDSQVFIMGPEVSALESVFAEYCEVKHAIGVSSGTDALLAALMAYDIGPGDEVITTPYTFFSTAGAISRLGATPVFVDIDPTSFNMCPSSLTGAIGSRTKAIIPVHLYGQCSDMTNIMPVAKSAGLPVIEDAAQAIGAKCDAGLAGGIGDIGCFSFFPSKNLGAFGDGGMITTSDDILDEKIRRLRVHGAKPKYYHSIVGGNFRLDALQAAVIRAKLPYLDDWTAARQRNRKTYIAEFQAARILEGLVTVPPVNSCFHVFNQFVIRVSKRDQLMAYLKENGIGCEIYYPVPLHLQECYAELGYRRGSFPHAELAAAETLALPIYPELTEMMIARVVDVISKFYTQPITSG